MQDQTFMTLMKVLPKSTLSTVVGRLVRAPAPAALHQAAMRAFARRFSIAMDEAEGSFETYRTFADFFARGLRPGARPIAAGETVLVSPVDAAVSQVGYSEHGECLQAKGISYPVAKLLADEREARDFEAGAFATLYLSPRDYHRIHAPLGGHIEGYAYVPGEFWPVNQASVRTKEALFCVNERLVIYFATPNGRLALIAVGATCVARIRASFDEIVTHSGEPPRTHRYPEPIPVAKGDEVARFEMGSTVILLAQPGRVVWTEALVPEARVQVGQRIGAPP